MWKLIEIAELGVQDGEGGVSMPCCHLALHRNPLDSVLYNALQVCKTSFPVTSPCVLTASGEEKGVALIVGNIPGLWANTLGGKLEIMTKIFLTC